MTNLLVETIGCLIENGKTPSDVLWVQHSILESGKWPRGYKTTWEDFCAKANFEYDNDYGWVEIPGDLLIVGRDFWLERDEYDGCEWWEFKTIPSEPEEQREIECLRIRQ